MTVWTLQDQLAEIINMLLDRHPMGLRVLTGEAPPPTEEEIHLMYAAGRDTDDLGVRVDGVEHVPHAEQFMADVARFQRVIEKTGGWTHIISTAKAWEAYKPQTWAVVQDHVTWVTSGSFSRLDDPQLQRVAIRHGLSTETVQRYRREFPPELSEIILKSRLCLDLDWMAVR